MKKVIFLSLFVGAILLISSSCRKENNLAEVIHNCTGSYVKINGDTHKVLNYSLIESYATGTSIHIDYRFDEPNQTIGDDSQTICLMYYAYKGHLLIEKLY